MPRIAFAGGLGKDVVGAVMNGKVQGDDGVAAVSGRQCLGVVTGSIIYSAVPRIFFTIDSCDCRNHRRGLSHLLCSRIPTSVGIRACDGVNSSCTDRCSGSLASVVPIVRTCAHGGERDVVSLAEGTLARDGDVRQRVDGQNKGDDTVAAFG